ncbi:MAG: lactate utilization protein [Deltaproteobacteria bacterium]|nr:lactate utilization protein [Deltaproteobacteria bacterium]MBW2307283.1 lactate utilization protein [Deltaproteobacteria bacterium]
MKEWEQWFMEKRAQRAVDALRRNWMEAEFVPTSAQAVEKIMAMIPDGASVGIGGSVTLGQIGLVQALADRPVKLLNPFSKGVSPEEGGRLRREIFTADYFLTGTNAVTENGELYNIDATGNRVGAMFFGPGRSIVVTGHNKIVRDLHAAHRRVKEWAAPMNARRLGYKTPCAETGVCSDCSSQERICRVNVTISKQPRFSNIHVFIIGETLGL